MPKTAKIKTANEDGSNDEVVEMVFDDKDWEILEDFAKYAAEMESNPLIRDGIPVSLNETWTAGEGLKVEAKIPLDEQIDAMLMKLRPFLLENESTNFDKVKNLIGKATSNERVRQHLKALDSFYSGAHMQSIFVAGAKA